MNDAHTHHWKHTNLGALGSSLWACNCGATYDGAKITPRVLGRIPDSHDERKIAAYEALGSNSYDRQQAMWAAAGIPELEARVEAVDLARENEVIRTIMQAHKGGWGWDGNATDVMHLHRALNRAKIVP